MDFPHCLLNSQTLQVLKINIRSQLRLPQQICLPNLKRLTLRCRSFRDYHELNLLLATSTLEELVIDTSNIYNAPAGQLFIPPPKLLPNLKKLKLKCITLRDYHALNLLFAGSALEDLVLKNCTWEGNVPDGHLVISAPNLRNINIADDIDSYDGLASVTISSPLKTFYYKGSLIKDYRLSCSSSMERATFFFAFNHFSDVEEAIPAGHFFNVLRSLLFVKYLGLSAYALWVLSVSEARLPVFNNLTSLEIFEGIDGAGYNAGLENILKKCPYLKTLKLPGGSLAECDTKCLLSPKLKCLSSLKNITIECFKGNTKELVAVHILLADAMSLETLEIGWSSQTMDASERKKIITFLFNMPRGSKSCKLGIRSYD